MRKRSTSGRDARWSSRAAGLMSLSSACWPTIGESPPADKLTGRAIKYYTCLTGLVMVDKLRDAVNEWYKENTQDPVMPGGKLNAVSEALREQMSAPAPVPMLLTCPMCTKRHIDEGEFATKGHHTHACQSCGTCGGLLSSRQWA